MREGGTFSPAKATLRPVDVVMCTDKFAQAAKQKTEYHLYWIHDGIADRYYIGVSRDPEIRIRDHLNNRRGSKSKEQLSANFKRYRKIDKDLPPDQRHIQWGHIARPHDVGKNSYKDVLIACITEFLFMRHLEDKLGKQIYNENYKGGHQELGDARPAFNAIVKILKPSLKELPTETEVASLGHYAPNIKKFIEKTAGREILNEDIFALIKTGYDAHFEQKKENFGEPVRSNPLKTVAGHKFIVGQSLIPQPPAPDDSSEPPPSGTQGPPTQEAA